MTIYIVQHYDFDRDDIIGVFTDEAEARAHAFDRASQVLGHHNGDGINVNTYCGSGTELGLTSKWKAPRRPARPGLSDQHLAMQKEHEEDMKAYERALVLYAADEEKYRRPE